tara:strand:- start:328 stop:504 length:177 start_codon:yes stop_codon:yes gene_type:complete
MKVKLKELRLIIRKSLIEVNSRILESDQDDDDIPVAYECDESDDRQQDECGRMPELDE